MNELRKEGRKEERKEGRKEGRKEKMGKTGDENGNGRWCNLNDGLA